MSTSTRRPGAAETRTTPPPVVRITLGVILAIIVAMVACTQLASTSGGASSGGPSPADVLPAGFPVPAGAQVVGEPAAQPGSGVITLSVPGSADEIVAFYGEQLPSSGWRTEPWDGTNPYGQPTQGLVLRRDGKEGALSVTETEDGLAMVQINLNQPVSPTEPGAGHGSS